MIDLRPFLAGLAVLLALGGCGDMGNDLVPSGDDKRGDVQLGTEGNNPGQRMADFTLPTTEDGVFTLSDYLEGGADPSEALVFYFTMWCPICTGHQDRMLFDMMPLYEGRGRVRWVLVDYVSGSVEVARAAQRDTGFLRTSFIVAVDEVQDLTDHLDTSMSSTVVVDSGGVILMNETFRDGSALTRILDALLSP